jgi:hypothetical protein
MRLGPKKYHGISGIVSVAQSVGLDPNYIGIRARVDMPKLENVRQLKLLLLLN